MIPKAKTVADVNNFIRMYANSLHTEEGRNEFFVNLKEYAPEAVDLVLLELDSKSGHCLAINYPTMPYDIDIH